MTRRQKIIALFYPLIMFFTKSGNRGTTLTNEKKQTPPVSFYDLKFQNNRGENVDFSQFKGKQVLLVNTASDCGFTAQFDPLQKLHETKRENLVILGFPANDFKEQEKGNDSDIAQFCQLNFGVTFPLMKKSSVVKKAEQNPVHQWLTDSKKNGWNDHQPDWNFSKYLVDENGKLMNYFGPSISPLSKEILDSLK